MKYSKKLTQEIKRIIKEEKLNCSIEEFKDRVNWDWISERITLSEDFIREFDGYLDWTIISSNQPLSESLIRKFKNEVYWYLISKHQNLSEDFIREFTNMVDWDYISEYQNLSKEFIKEFKYAIDIKLYKAVHKTISKKQKVKEVKAYAKKYGLKFNSKYFYAYRNHDIKGCGLFLKNTRYKEGVYYRDWHLDMRPEKENSFGYGIWEEGNTLVKVKIEDWGVEVVSRRDSKARVWGFEIVKEGK